MTDHDPTTVECPDCLVPAGTPCIVSTSDTPVHAARRRLVDLRNLAHGACALCGQFMVRGTVEDSPLDAWHPDPVDAAACPNLGDPSTDWEAYAANVNLGLTPGHPGLEHFVAADLTEQGRILASRRDDLIAAGADPSSLAIPLGLVDDIGTASGLTPTEVADSLARALNDPVTGPIVPAAARPALCPECTHGKHLNCALQALDPFTDELVACACNDDAHRTASDA